MGINLKHVGSNFDDFLKEEGIYEEVVERVIKRSKKMEAAKKRLGRKLISKYGVSQLLNVLITAIAEDNVDYVVQLRKDLEKAYENYEKRYDN